MAPDAAALWSLGDYPAIALRLQPAAEALVEAAGVRAGDRVLDVAAGNGNVAAAAAARGARVTATDVAPVMVELGRARTGANVTWQEADAQDLPFADGTFDHALSAFGMIFAPEPEGAAAEMLRVVVPGGIAAMTAWAADAVQAATHEVLSRHLPSGDGPLPREWGDEATARARFAAAGSESVRIVSHRLRWVFPSVDAWMKLMSEAAPPIVAARQALGDRWPQVLAELREAIWHAGADTPDGFLVEPTYLLLVARR